MIPLSKRTSWPQTMMTHCPNKSYEFSSFDLSTICPTRSLHFYLTSVTAGTVGRSCIYTCGTGVVTHMTQPTGLVLALGTCHQTTALIQRSEDKETSIKTRKINTYKLWRCKWAELISIPACTIWHIYTDVDEWVNKWRGDRATGRAVWTEGKVGDFG